MKGCELCWSVFATGFPVFRIWCKVDQLVVVRDSSRPLVCFCHCTVTACCHGFPEIVVTGSCFHGGVCFFEMLLFVGPEQCPAVVSRSGKGCRLHRARDATAGLAPPPRSPHVIYECFIDHSQCSEVSMTILNMVEQLGCIHMSLQYFSCTTVRHQAAFEPSYSAISMSGTLSLHSLLQRMIGACS